jgi:O-acetyl-ADP-ribose deacetylase (regulator of RNase III)
VLLRDLTTKKGESAKLKRRYTGPFIIIECKPGFNYRLQHLDTGRTLRRLVHADRLRPYCELDNDYRPNGGQQTRTVAEGTTGRNNVRWRVTVGDPLAVSADMLVHSVDPQLSFLNDVADRLRVAAGDAVVQQCKEARQKAGDAECTPLTTTAGRMSHVRLLLHVVPPTLVGAPLDDQARLKEAYTKCFEIAAGEQATCLAVPFPLTGEEQATALWPEAQAAADAIVHLSESTSGNSLQEIEFVNVSLLTADILSTVCRSTLTRSAGEGTPRPTEPKQPEPVDKQSVAGPPADPNKWYEIDQVIAHRRYRSKDQYLVKWKDSNETSWVRREDLSPAALQQFYATRKHRRRKRKT